MLEDNCYEREMMDFTRQYSGEEISKLKDHYAKDMIFLAKKQEQLDDIKAEFKTEMNPVKLEAAEKLKGIRSSQMEVNEEVFVNANEYLRLDFNSLVVFHNQIIKIN